MVAGKGHISMILQLYSFATIITIIMHVADYFLVKVAIIETFRKSSNYETGITLSISGTNRWDAEVKLSTRLQITTII